MHILFALLVAVAPNPEDAELSHAQGLLLEVDGKAAEAVAKLREAASADPQNVDYAYDAARLAWQSKAAGWEDDAERFLKLTPKTPDQWLLRSYLEAARGESAKAKASVRQSLQLKPEAQEAIGVRNMLDAAPEGGAPAHKSWNVHGKAALEVDDNVTLIPDAKPFGQGGGRTTLGAGGAWLPRTENTSFSLGADVNFGIHFANPKLTPFNYFKATVAGTSDTRWGADKQQRFFARAFMDQTTLGMFTTHFLQEFGGHAEYQYSFGLPTLGVYADGSYRDFRNNIYNIKNSSTDRTGARWAGGASLSLGNRDFVALLTGGFQTEWAYGYNQRELGPSVSLGASYTWWRMLFRASVGYDNRTYPLSNDGGVKRWDNRIPVSVAAQINPLPWLGIELSYLYVRNFSSVSVFDYHRNIGALAVKVSY